MSDYLDRITGLLARIEREAAGPLARASDAVADVICRDGLVHVFGCGHSHLPALDAFYRAGGLSDRRIFACLRDELRVKLRYGASPLTACGAYFLKLLKNLPRQLLVK